MKKVLDRDLTDLGDIMESLIAKLEKGQLTQAEKIDIAARLKPVVKHCENFDTQVKDMVKLKRVHIAGDVLGTTFKATLNIVPVERLDQAAFKAEKPAMFDRFKKYNDEERITYSVR